MSKELKITILTVLFASLTQCSFAQWQRPLIKKAVHSGASVAKNGSVAAQSLKAATLINPGGGIQAVSGGESKASIVADAVKSSDFKQNPLYSKRLEARRAAALKEIAGGDGEITDLELFAHLNKPGIFEIKFPISSYVYGHGFVLKTPNSIFVNDKSFVATSFTLRNFLTNPSMGMPPVKIIKEETFTEEAKTMLYNSDIGVVLLDMSLKAEDAFEGFDIASQPLKKGDGVFFFARNEEIRKSKVKGIYEEVIELEDALYVPSSTWSGLPLFNMKGEVVGVLTFSPRNISQPIFINISYVSEMANETLDLRSSIARHSVGSHAITKEDYIAGLGEEAFYNDLKEGKIIERSSPVGKVYEVSAEDPVESIFKNRIPVGQSDVGILNNGKASDIAPYDYSSAINEYLERFRRIIRVD